MMTNLERYNFQDFTRENYRRLLKLAKQRYVFRSYINFNPDERFMLWRHDIDISPQNARKLAKIEAEEDVVATYFLHLHSEFYNLLERSVSDCVRDIIRLGHAIGLHFDSTFYGIDDENQLEAFLKFEQKIIERTFSQKLNVFSFHDPDGFAMKCRQHQYSGLVNTYSDYFQTKVGYCSDSNGYWRFRRLEDVIREGEDKRLQVLTHPCYWTDEVMSPRQRVWRCTDGRAKATRDWWTNHLSVSGREDVDWE